jgi:hypothetical protein
VDIERVAIGGYAEYDGKSVGYVLSHSVAAVYVQVSGDITNSDAKVVDQRQLSGDAVV